MAEYISSPEFRAVAGRAPSFAEGQRVAERYRVERFLARGGMGEVYAVEDLELHERVALKTVQPRVAADPEALERLKRELRLARRVTHPNVCRLFDLGLHVGEGGQEVYFLTMELLEGQMLQALLRQGRLRPEQALEVAGQVAAGLDAAHAAQVIHRDLKPSNVALVPSPGAPGGQRVVVVDFGLAASGLPERDAWETQEGTLLGSPSYMSPEQVEGLALTPASDVYAFGVVLYEMVTGRVPFVGPNAAATAVLRLRQPPPSPRLWAPELPPVWESVLLRCLAREPQERYARAGEAVVALRESLEAAPAHRARPAPRRTVAVLPPRNLSARADKAWLSTALAELLAAELAVSGQVRTLPGEAVARMHRELALPEPGSLAVDTLVRMHEHSGVDLVLTGAFLALGEAEEALLRVDVRLQECLGGEVLAQLTESGPERELLGWVVRMGAVLRERLRLEPPAPGPAHERRRALPTVAEAVRPYAEGLAALRRHEAALAAERLQQALALEPGFAPAWSALAAACQQLFHQEQAREAAGRAYALSSGLCREERLLVEGRYHEACCDWELALEAYRTLFDFFPDTLEYGLALAAAQVAAGRLGEAQATAEALRRLPPPRCEDARIELAAARVAAAAADFAQALRHAEAAVVRARRAGQRLLVATALIEAGYAWRNLGEPLRAVEMMEESERLYLEGGDRGGAARALLLRAMALVDVGRLWQAEGVLAVALGVARELRSEAMEAELLENEAWLSCHLGRLNGALERARRVLELYERLGLVADAVRARVLAGMVGRCRGEWEQAQRLLEAGQRGAGLLGDGYTEAWACYELGLVQLEQGQPVEARLYLERALALRQAHGLRVFVAETELGLARVELEQGRPEESLRLAERALAALLAQPSADRQGLAHVARALTLLARGEPQQARAVLQRARALAGSSESVLVGAELVLAEARLALQAGTDWERQAAVQRLDGLLAWAASAGARALEQQARHALEALAPECHRGHQPPGDAGGLA